MAHNMYIIIRTRNRRLGLCIVYAGGPCVRVLPPLYRVRENDITIPMYTILGDGPQSFRLSQVLPAAAELFLNLNEIVTQDQLIALNIL